MNEIQRYLAGEVTVDFADGLIGRREALRRLALLGVGAASAASLLAACDSPPRRPGGAGGAAGGSAPSGSNPPPSPVDPSAPAGPPPLATEPVTFGGPDGRRLQGVWAPAATTPVADGGGAAPVTRGSVLVIHENRGLTDHIRSVAGRFAASGFAALAIDLLSAEGGTASFADPAQATAALGKVPPQRFVADMKAGVTELLRRAPDRHVGAVGFCFGGGMVWQLLAAGEPRLFAAAPFYGPIPADADLSFSANAAVLAVYAEKDARINAGIDAAKGALMGAGLVHEVMVYPGVDHAFFNDTGGRYNAAVAAQAYQKVVSWFRQHLS